MTRPTLLRRARGEREQRAECDSDHVRQTRRLASPYRISMRQMSSPLPRTVAVIERGIEDGLHLGAQGYVSVDGRPVAELAIGQARAGVPMSADQMIVWFSMTKPVVAVSVARLWE